MNERSRAENKTAERYLRFQRKHFNDFLPPQNSVRAQLSAHVRGFDSTSSLQSLPRRCCLLIASFLLHLRKRFNLFNI